jgi:CheY-like chemotaxis protein/anti-sigma regulatory factor (Ser/Thr protein kinase)
MEGGTPLLTVLVVDDSMVDRRFVGSLLERFGDLRVEYAADGAEALEKMAQSVPAVVLTDMIMPEMNGLELVAAVRSKYPSVPSILMTSLGNEQLAVQAMRQGAASYVPKRTLAHDLLPTVRSVLEVSQQEEISTRLMEYMTGMECRFVLDNDRSLISPLVGYLQESVAKLGLCNETDKVRIGIALDEALVNALYHGNLEVSSLLREEDGAGYDLLVAQRLGETPFRDRRIYVDVKLSPQRAVFVVRDEGPGFDPLTLPDPTDPSNLDQVTGRGVLLMRTFMDEVHYNDAGNCVTMVKFRNGPLNALS